MCGYHCRGGSARRHGLPLSCFAAAAQPRKLCLQHADGLGGGFARYRRRLHGERGRSCGAACALVPGVGAASAGAHAAQLLWGLVE
jgi:hypothetical protein